MAYEATNLSGELLLLLLPWLLLSRVNKIIILAQNGGDSPNQLLNRDTVDTLFMKCNWASIQLHNINIGICSGEEVVSCCLWPAATVRILRLH